MFTTRDISEPKWRKVNLTSDPKVKYWFFNSDKKTKANGYGVLYILSNHI